MYQGTFKFPRFSYSPEWLEVLFVFSALDSQHFRSQLLVEDAIAPCPSRLRTLVVPLLALTVLADVATVSAHVKTASQSPEATPDGRLCFPRDVICTQDSAVPATREHFRIHIFVGQKAPLRWQQHRLGGSKSRTSSLAPKELGFIHSTGNEDAEAGVPTDTWPWSSWLGTQLSRAWHLGDPPPSGHNYLTRV